MKRLAFLTIILATFALASTAMSDPLVTVNDGVISAGIAEKWEIVDDTTVLFYLNGPNANEAKAQLENVFEGKAVITVIDDTTLQIKGMPTDDIYKTVASVDIATTEEALADDDPLAGLDGGLALDMPDGSSSLRARKRAKVDNGDKKKKLSGDSVIKVKVIKVERAVFPHVTLTVIVLKAPKKGDLGIKVKTKIKIKPAFEKIDMENPQFQTNVGANFFRKGDRILIDISGKEGDIFTAKALQRIR